MHQSAACYGLNTVTKENGEYHPSTRISEDPMTNRRSPMSSRLRLTLEPSAPIQTSLVTILRQLLISVEGNVAGVLEDTDPEFLHCFRVAVRRTRSAIGQIPGALPKRILREFNHDFRWLGARTGPCRDLDVWLRDIPTTYETLDNDWAEPLSPIIDEACRERTHASRQVSEALTSNRFLSLMAGWRRFLDQSASIHEPPPKALRPTLKVARKRILKAHRRVMKPGNAVDGSLPPQDLHRLRIDCKKLRYLLEFFSSLFSKERLVPLIQSLKELQDILGVCNDCTVQQEILSRLPALSITKGRAQGPAQSCDQRLANLIEQRRLESLEQLASRYSEFRERSLICD